MNTLPAPPAVKRRPAMPGYRYLIPAPYHPPPLVIRGPLDGYTGYGQTVTDIVLGLAKLGHDVRIWPTVRDLDRTPVNPRMLSLLADSNPASRELVIHPPDCINLLLREGVDTVYLTMWETTVLRPEWVAGLNRCRAVIVPNVWNASCFSAAGVKVPIYVVPLGIDAEYFPPEVMPTTGTFVFGAAGRYAHGGTRKGLEEVVKAFKLAFPGKEDVELRLKCFADCAVEFPDEPRIKVLRAFLTKEEMAQWYRGIHCFVSGAKAEGWGLHQHQAMAAGKPVIAAIFGGLAEFLDEAVCYPVKFLIREAVGFYRGLGHWADPEITSIAQQMRYAYEHRDDCQRRGLNAAVRARRFSNENCVAQIEEVLKREGLL